MKIPCGTEYRESSHHIPLNLAIYIIFIFTFVKRERDEERMEILLIFSIECYWLSNPSMEEKTCM